MEHIDHEELAQLMADMADDRATVVAFVESHGDRLAAVARHHLRSFGRLHLLRDDEEVGSLVWDIALFLQERAGAWKPGSALPWNWARHGIRKLVADAVGHATAGVDVELLDVSWTPPAPARDVDFADMASRDPVLALLHEALATIPCTERDRSVHVEYRIQWLLDDPSPAHTAAVTFGLQPDNVRQIDRRVRKRLQLLCEADQHFADLATLPWLTGRKRPGMAA